MAEQHGVRNAQVSVIAPTGTIGLVMDCDTTGIEPDFALVKFKKLAGGGFFKIINRMVPTALETLGYDKAQIDAITRYAVGHGTLKGAPGIDHAKLRAKGFTSEVLAKLEAGLPTTFDIRYAFNRHSLGDAFCKDVLGFTDEQLGDIRFDMLQSLGFSRDDDRAGERLLLRHHDHRGCAGAARRSICRSSTAPTRAAGSASATSRRRATSA